MKGPVRCRDRWPDVCDWSADGRKLIACADDDGLVPVVAIDAPTGGVERVTPPEAGGAHSDPVALPDGRIAGIRSSVLEAPECFVTDPGADSVPRPLASLRGPWRRKRPTSSGIGGAAGPRAGRTNRPRGR